jgi:hypothetical protein
MTIDQAAALAAIGAPLGFGVALGAATFTLLVVSWCRLWNWMINALARRFRR